MEKKLPRSFSARNFFALLTISLLIFGFTIPGTAETEVVDKGKQLILGEKLYFDVNLSINKNQSCNTCHNANPMGTNSVGTFVDDRLISSSRLASLKFPCQCHKALIQLYLAGEIHRVPLMPHSVPPSGSMKLPDFMSAVNSGMVVK